MNRDVIIACDFSSAKETYDFLNCFDEKKPFIKIGMELFYSTGPDIVRKLKGEGYRIFLDLKLHDIPNTVRKAMANLAGLGTDILNLHAAGSGAMMRAALEGVKAAGGARPLVIAVTQLTSIDGDVLKKELLIDKPMDETVMSYAKNAALSGLDGVVCSPLEAAKVKEVCGAGFITVTPGIRFPENEAGDQKRIMTPERAKDNGCDFIVVGRAITAAKDPKAAYIRACNEFLGRGDK